VICKPSKSTVSYRLATMSQLAHVCARARTHSQAAAGPCLRKGKGYLCKAGLQGGGQTAPIIFPFRLGLIITLGPGRREGRLRARTLVYCGTVVGTVYSVVSGCERTLLDLFPGLRGPLILTATWRPSCGTTFQHCGSNPGILSYRNRSRPHACCTEPSLLRT
jgi:hypothetical protein